MPYPKKRKSDQADQSASAKRHKGEEPAMLGRSLRTAQACLARHTGNASAQRSFAQSSVPQASYANYRQEHGTGGPRSPIEALLTKPIYGKGGKRSERTRPSRQQQRPAQRRPRDRRDTRRMAESAVYYTEEYIYNNLNIPTAAEYNLSTEPIDNCLDILREANLPAKKQSQHESPHKTSYIHKIIHKVELDDDILITAIGHGRTTAEAERNAALHVLCKLHGQKLFQDILPGGKYAVPAQSDVAVEASAKRDIIDYAARHDCLPVFEVTHGRPPLMGKSVTTQVSIKEMNLVGRGRAKTADGSLVRACIMLKKAAEALHEESGEGVLLVKDFTKLTTSSSKQFVDFHCYQAFCRASLEAKRQSKKDAWRAVVTITPSTVGSRQDPPDPDIEASHAVLASDTTRSFEGIGMQTKKDAEDTAWLAAALDLKKEDPTVWKSFVKEMRRGNGEILKPVKPIDVHFENKALQVMKETVLQADSLSSLEHSQEASEEDDYFKSNYTPRSRQLNQDAITQKSQDLKDGLEQYRSSPRLEDLRRKREELPMVQYRRDLMNLVRENDVCVVVGATGSGKTTQLPQLILEEMVEAGNGGNCNIVCTQPRRIAAISVAQRVAVERDEPLQKSVGYAVRFDNKMPEFGGSINFCTTGILLRQLQDSQDATLDGISHIIVDEVHERDIQIDFLLVVLRRIMADRKKRGLNPVKLVLMSATIDTNLFCKYFGTGFETGHCPHISVPGRTFPVTSHHLDEIYPLLSDTYPRSAAADLHTRDTQSYVTRELSSSLIVPNSAAVETADKEDDGSKGMIDWRSKGVVGEDGEMDVSLSKEDTTTPIGLIAVTIAHILKTTTQGSILCFLPGLQEITALEKLLKATKPLGIDFGDSASYKLYMLHSAIPQMQQEVFEKLDGGIRKVIISTNIAETSITIPDVVYVVDSAKHRQAQYDPLKRISSLVSTWVSKSNAKQRAGRAGRVQNGHYYSMASIRRHESFEVSPLPEIRRTDLQELCLTIKSMGIQSIDNFLRQAIEPPPASTVEASIDHLQSLKALDDDENLTPLGKILSKLPVQPSLGKMVLMGIIFRCLDPVLILAVASTFKEPFLSPLNNRDEADKNRAKWAKGTGSDHAALVNAFCEWRETRLRSPSAEKAFAYDNFLHRSTLVSIAQTCDQIIEIMQKAGLVAKPDRHDSRRFKSRYGSEEENINSSSLALQNALATAGFQPNVAVQTFNPRLLRTPHENAAQIHISSLAAPKSDKGRYGPISESSRYLPGTMFTFSQKTQADGNNIALRGVAKTTPLAVILFGNHLKQAGKVLTVDEWLPFYGREFFHHKVAMDMNRVLSQYLERTFSRLSIDHSSRSNNGVKDRNSFLVNDPVREPLTTGVIQALELCDPASTAHRSLDLFGSLGSGRTRQSRNSSLSSIFDPFEEKQLSSRQYPARDSNQWDISDRSTRHSGGRRTKSSLRDYRKKT